MEISKQLPEANRLQQKKAGRILKRMDTSIRKRRPNLKKKLDRQAKVTKLFVVEKVSERHVKKYGATSCVIRAHMEDMGAFCIV